ncbi:hypothetical protein [Candidatus Magnetominusculus xianensis]|uniref:Secreted protein n=1 Tax=Candidatus Magnetominusculus xianensis TaxID=1748249 RepID=A0ABR5SAY7_9BACT|nr:hypothetical protein [Candidatus Magnetominusculus xianensis]KWT73779.1 hypothetical protein ASN18_3361 [Candidatus Magnetominusculus xianensis]MBF0404800.1 hypothetical protein [Nitrospirota bacterium]
MGNFNIQGLLQVGIGLLSLFGAAGLPRNYVGGITQILGGLESMFAHPHEVGSVSATPSTPANPAATANQGAS